MAVKYTLPIMFNNKKDDATTIKVVGSKGAGAGNGQAQKTEWTMTNAEGLIYVVDGKVVDNISNLNSENIDNITVIKDKNLVAEKYGVKDKNGVIEITMKKK